MNPLFGGIVGQDPHLLTVRLSLFILATWPTGAQATTHFYYLLRALQAAVLSLDQSLRHLYS